MKHLLKDFGRKDLAHCNLQPSGGRLNYDWLQKKKSQPKENVDKQDSCVKKETAGGATPGQLSLSSGSAAASSLGLAGSRVGRQLRTI